MLEKLKGLRTIVCGALIVIAGAVIQYHQNCQTDPALADICSHLVVPGWALSVLGAGVVWFRKLAGTGK